MKKLMSILVGALLAIGVQAQALTIKPGTTPVFTGSVNNTPGMLLEIAAMGIVLGTELYKQDVPASGPDSGPFASSYTTAFFNSSTDPEDATITYVAGTSIMTDANYLLVKDGNTTPAWYLFALTGASAWNGTDTLYLEDFWAGQGQAGRGAISHVALYGGETPAVPEPGTMMLLGVGMFGLAIFGKRRMNK